jgi:hypothetical protein
VVTEKRVKLKRSKLAKSIANTVNVSKFKLHQIRSRVYSNDVDENEDAVEEEDEDW